MNDLKFKVPRRFLTFSLVLSLMLGFARSSYANTFCVNTATELQTALARAANNGENDDIRIVQGTYVGNFVYSGNESDNLIIKGGYGKNCSSRVIKPSNTVLDGNGMGATLVLSVEQVVYWLIDGITVRNGKASNAGGGFYMRTSGGSVTVSNSIIERNMTINDGGGIYVKSGVVTFTNNTITNNTASSDGGGGYIETPYYGVVTFTNNIITGNTSFFCGGVYVHAPYGTVTFTNNAITNNTFATGNGINIHAPKGIVTFTNNR
jgi:hypothetical protein